MPDAPYEASSRIAKALGFKPWGEEAQVIFRELSRDASSSDSRVPALRALIERAAQVREWLSGSLMADTPDFDAIARALLTPIDFPAGHAEIVKQLRLIWNARGQADIEAIGGTFASHR